MNFSRTFTILTFWVMSSLHLYAEKGLVLHYRGGQTVRVELSEIPSVRVDKDHLVLEYASGILEVPIAEVDYFNVEEGQPTTVGQVKVEMPTLTRIGDNTFAVSGAKTVSLFTIDGKLLLQSHGYTTFNLTDYEATVLVIKADDKTFKFTNN